MSNYEAKQDVILNAISLRESADAVIAALRDGSVKEGQIEVLCPSGLWSTLLQQDLEYVLSQGRYLRIKQRTIKVNTPYYSPATEIWYTVVNNDSAFQVKRAGNCPLGFLDSKLCIRDDLNPQALTRDNMTQLGGYMAESIWNNLKEAKIDV